MAINHNRRVRISWAASYYRANDDDGIRIRIEASDAALMADKLFAYQLLPLNPATGTRVGQYDHVCSSVDLEEYPEDEPITNSRPAWFRLDYVDILLRTQEEADEFLATVLGDVRRLKATLDIMDTLIGSGEEWIDDEPAEEESSSESASMGA